MGAIGGMLGLGGGASGTGFAAPGMAPIQNPTSQEQINKAYAGTQAGINAQDQLLRALQAQQGLQNQSDVYGQLQNIAAGKGPNPAQAMLNQETAKNVANQAALMAGQRGAGANAGLIARQAAQQGANLQQQAVGQGATMQAQQALGAVGQAGQLATQQAQQQMQGTQGLTNAQMSEQQALMNAQQGYNNNLVGMQSNINQANAGLAQTQMRGQQGLVGGILGGIGSALGLAEGGEVPASGPQSAFAKHLKDNDAFNFSMSDEKNPMQMGMQSATAGLINALKPKAALASSGIGMGAPGVANQRMAGFAKGGKVRAKVSPGEVYLSPKEVEEVECGANPMDVGEKIPGKPRVGGAVNSYANDVVSKKLDAGGIVVPRSKTKSENPRENSAKFVASILAKKRMRTR